MPDTEAAATTSEPTAETPVDQAPATETPATPAADEAAPTQEAPDTAALLSRFNDIMGDLEDDGPANNRKTEPEEPKAKPATLPDLGPLKDRLIRALGDDDGLAVVEYLQQQHATIAELKELLGRHTGEFDQVKAKVGGWEQEQQKAAQAQHQEVIRSTHSWFNEKKADRYGGADLKSHTPAQQAAREEVYGFAQGVARAAQRAGKPMSWTDALATAEAIKFGGGKAEPKRIPSTINPAAVRGGGGGRSRPATPQQEFDEQVAAHKAVMAKYRQQNRG